MIVLSISVGVDRVAEQGRAVTIPQHEAEPVSTGRSDVLPYPAVHRHGTSGNHLAVTDPLEPLPLGSADDGGDPEPTLPARMPSTIACSDKARATVDGRPMR